MYRVRSLLIVLALAASAQTALAAPVAATRAGHPSSDSTDLYGDWVFAWQNWNTFVETPQATTRSSTDLWDSTVVALTSKTQSTAWSTKAVTSADRATVCDYYAPNAMVAETMRGKWVCVTSDGDVVKFVLTFVREGNGLYGTAVFPGADGSKISVPLMGYRLDWTKWSADDKRVQSPP